MAEDQGTTAARRAAGVAARWLGAALILVALFCWLTGLSGGGYAMIAGGVLLIAGMAVAIADRRDRPAGAAAPPPSPMLAALTLVMAIVALLIGAGRTMGSAPSSENDFLLERVGLAAALGLVILAVVAFATPRLRPHMALAASTTVGALLVLDVMLG